MIMNLERSSHFHIVEQTLHDPDITYFISSRIHIAWVLFRHIYPHLGVKYLDNASFHICNIQNRNIVIKMRWDNVLLFKFSEESISNLHISLTSAITWLPICSCLFFGLVMWLYVSACGYIFVEGWLILITSLRLWGPILGKGTSQALYCWTKLPNLMWF